MKSRTMAIVLVAALVVAACGDDDAQTTTTSTTAPTEATSPAGDGDMIGVPSAQCLEFFTALSDAVTVTFGGEVTDLDAYVQSLQSMASGAPAEIRADFQVMADTFGAFARAMAAAGIDLSDPDALESAEALAAYITALESFDTEAFDRAMDNIDAYLTAVCE